MSKIDLLVVEPSGRERGLLSRGRENNVAEVDVALLQKSWDSVCDALKTTFETSSSVGAFSIEEIKISLSISAEGKFQLIAGASAGAEATVEVSLKKSNES